MTEVNGSGDASSELECLRRNSPPQRALPWHYSSYRVVDKRRDAICEYFSEQHSFTLQSDAFAIRENKRSDKLLHDA